MRGLSEITWNTASHRLKSGIPAPARRLATCVVLGCLALLLSTANLCAQSADKPEQSRREPNRVEANKSAEKERQKSEDGPAITEVSPSEVVAGKTYDIDITARWAEFRQGETKADFGSGITVNLLTVTDRNHMVANIAIDAAAQTGDRTITLQTRTGTVTLDKGLHVNEAVTINGPAGSGRRISSEQGIKGETSVSRGAPEVSAGPIVPEPAAAPQRTAPPHSSSKTPTGPPVPPIQVGSTSQTGLSPTAPSQEPGLPRDLASNEPEKPSQTAGDQTISLAPNAGAVGEKLEIAITGTNTDFVQGLTAAKFGTGIAVGNSPPGGFGLVTVTSPTTATAEIAIYRNAQQRDPHNVFVRTNDVTATLIHGFTVTPPPAAPVVTDFDPKSAPVGALVTVTGKNFIGMFGTGPRISLSQQGGGTIAGSVSEYTDTTLSFVIPTAAATGKIQVTVGTQSGKSSENLTITTPSSFTVSVSPDTLPVIQGQEASFSVSLNSDDGFNQLATLDASGIPKGMTWSFSPPKITAGQVSILTLTAAEDQGLGISPITISGSATISGQDVVQTAKANVQVAAVSTSFIGRTVVDDYKETPLAGVTVKLLGLDGSGNNTGCSGQTVSDDAGNFSLTNLPENCTGPQLIGYDGSTATHPEGKYAGVNLVYKLTSKHVLVSPVLVHLPRIDDKETVQVQQNAPNDQYFTFQSIPGLLVTVYAGTTFKLEDDTQPDPFPLTAIHVPVDRLPDPMPVSGTITPFIVAFQPANAVASQSVAVNFPNTLGTAPGVSVPLMTLDPTRGSMVPYGTGTVANDGMRIVPDPDPDHPGHAYGLVHFDWHGQTLQPPPTKSPSPGGCGGCGCPGGDDPPTSGPDSGGG